VARHLGASFCLEKCGPNIGETHSRIGFCAKFRKKNWEIATQGHIFVVMKTVLASLSLLLPCLAFGGDFPAGSPHFFTSYDAAAKAAKASGKPMVVVFSASWCPPCQVMKKEVYPSAEVKPWHSRFEWVYLDVDQKANGALADKFGVSGIPHIEFLDKDGNSVGEQVGSLESAEFVKRLEKASKKAGS
jgi:thioredoxin-related protein